MKILTLWLVGVLAFSGIALMPSELVAADVVSYYGLYYPSAFNATYSNVPQYASGEATEVMVSDAVSQDLYYASQSSSWLFESNDFTNPDWTQPYNYSYVIGTLPPDNATIISLMLVARFMTASPTLYLMYSTNGGVYWDYSSEIAAGYGPQYWNITAEETWTPDMLNTTDFWVGMVAGTIGGWHHYLDYLGIICLFTVPGGGGYVLPPEDPLEGDTFEYGFIYTAEGIIGILGLVGLVGMVAAPALGVYVYRRGGEGKMNIFVKMLVLFMFCLTLFMVSISGA